jgi:hypothetical protein
VNSALALVPFALLFALAVFPFFAFVLRQGAAFGTPRVATLVKPIVGMQLIVVFRELPASVAALD